MIAYLSGKIVLVLQNQIIVKIPSGIGYLVNISGEFLVNENIDLFIWHDNLDFWGFYSWQDRNWLQSLISLGVLPSVGANLIWQNGEKKLSQEVLYGNGNIFVEAGIDRKIINKIIKNSQPIKTENNFFESVAKGEVGNFDSQNELRNGKKKISEVIIEKEKPVKSVNKSPEQSESQISSPKLKHYHQNLDSNSNSNLNSANFKKSKTNGVLSLEFTDKMTDLGYGRGEIVSCITLLKKQNIWNESPLEILVEKGQKLLKKSKL